MSTIPSESADTIARTPYIPSSIAIHDSTITIPNEPANLGRTTSHRPSSIAIRDSSITIIIPNANEPADIFSTATGANEEILGFFTYIGNNGIVQNLIIEEVMITGTATGPHSFTDSNSRTGSLAGELKANGQINGVKIINTDSDTTGISVSSSYVGGLVGLIDGATITNSYTTGSVTGAGRVGGLVGRISGSNTITNNYATGNVFGSDEYVGGLVGVGYNDSDTTITNSYATGSVTGGSAQVGGLVGYSDSTIMNSYATGNVRGSGYSVGDSLGIVLMSRIAMLLGM